MNCLLIKRKTLYMILIYMAACFFFQIVGYSELSNKVIAIATIFLSFLFFMKCRGNLALMIISFFIAYANYSICVGIYLFPDMRPRYLYPQITDINVYGIGILMLLLFMLTLIVMTPYENVKVDKFVIEDNYNPLLCLISILAFLFVIIVGYTPSVNGRGNSSTLYEYGVIILMMAFYFSGGKKSWELAVFLGGVIYSLVSILNGTRVEALSCIFLLLVLGAGRQMSLYKFGGGAIVGIVLFQIVGTLRGNYSNIVETGSAIVSDLIDSKLVFNTCTHAYFPALCMIEQFKSFSFTEGIYFLERFLLTIVLGANRVKDGNLIAYVGQMYYHNDGGVSLGFFYVWFGYLGALVCGIIISNYLKLVSDSSGNRSALRMCCLVYLVISVPRWYLYGPWAFTRGILVCAVFFTIMNLADKLLRKYKA